MLITHRIGKSLIPVRFKTISSVYAGVNIEKDQVRAMGKPVKVSTSYGWVRSFPVFRG